MGNLGAPRLGMAKEKFRKRPYRQESLAGSCDRPVESQPRETKNSCQGKEADENFEKGKGEDK